MATQFHVRFPPLYVQLYYVYSDIKWRHYRICYANGWGKNLNWGLFTCEAAAA